MQAELEVIAEARTAPAETDEGDLPARIASLYASRCRRFHEDTGGAKLGMRVLVQEGETPLSGQKPTALKSHLMFLREADIALVIGLRRRSTPVEMPDVLSGRWGPLTHSRVSSFGVLIRHGLRRMDDIMSFERDSLPGFGKPLYQWLVHNKLLPLLLADERQLPDFYNFGAPGRPPMYLLWCGRGMSWPHMRGTMEAQLDSAIQAHEVRARQAAIGERDDLSTNDIMGLDPFGGRPAARRSGVSLCASTHPYWDSELTRKEFAAWYAEQRWFGGCWVPEQNDRDAAQWQLVMLAIHRKEIHPKNFAKEGCVTSTPATMAGICGSSTRTAYALACAVCFARCASGDEPGKSMTEAMHGDYTALLAAVEADADVVTLMRQSTGASDGDLCGSLYFALRCAEEANKREIDDRDTSDLVMTCFDYPLNERKRTDTDVAHPAQTVCQAVARAVTPFLNYGAALNDAMCVLRCVPRYRLRDDAAVIEVDTLGVINAFLIRNKQRCGICHWMLQIRDPGTPSPEALHAGAMGKPWTEGQHILKVLLAHFGRATSTSSAAHLVAIRMLRYFLDDVESECRALARYIACSSKLSRCGKNTPAEALDATASANEADKAVANMYVNTVNDKWVNLGLHLNGIPPIRNTGEVHPELITSLSAFEVAVYQSIRPNR
jgi:hypothetical protein